MFSLVAGSVEPARARLLATRVALILLPGLLAGCAQTNSYYSQSPAVAGYVRQASVEVEDDGLPAQAPPPARIRQMPDDPSEPFSPNYGGPNPSARAQTDERFDVPVKSLHQADPDRRAEVRIPDDLPPAFRSSLIAAVDANSSD